MLNREEDMKPESWLDPRSIISNEDMLDKDDGIYSTIETVTT
jgi:hypothetical protein